MRVVMHLLDGELLEWVDMPGDDVMTLTGALMHDISAPGFIQVTRADDAATLVVNTDMITRVEIGGDEP